MADDIKDKSTESKTSVKQTNKPGKASKSSGKPNNGKSSNKSGGGKQGESKPVENKSDRTAKSDSSKPAKQDKKAKPAKATQKKPNIFQRFIGYIRNVRLEVRRTSWPNRGEVGRMSLIVIGALLFFGFTIFGLDTLMTQVIRLYSQLSIGFVEPDAAFSLTELLEYTLQLIQ
ncbi:MAG: preprotein translocase subunit SecE [Coriobacteriales bacterium]|jgi:preprotein translocase subunit SecE|nr:preprotein translocase subunit SecE [Coriobacteriales bacterium]